ncbi:major capsid protein [Micromonospora zamorensis]|uniref:major capsid protein n=1 Tax=Micromonospora zamorensis TaxID=709883 RepID=UPI0036C0A022
MEFEIPGSLDGLDLDALGQLETQAVAAFDALRDDPALDAAGLARLRDLATFVQSVRTQQQQIEQAALQVASELDDLDAVVHSDAEAPANQADDAGGDVDGDGDGDEPPAEEDHVANVPAPQPTPVVASLARRAARRQPKPKLTSAGSAAVIKAAADVPNVPHGHVFSSVAEVASAFDDKFAGFPRGVGVATRIKQNVARVELPVDQALVAGGRGLTDMELVDLAATESRLSGGNLVAAGGWGAPSETLWELCEGLETTEGLLDLPGITIPRGGGIKVPSNLDFRDLYSAVGFVQTEADSTAGTDKPAYRVPTVNWAETRLEVDGVQIEQDIVQNAVWPELTRDVVRRALTAHEHKINARFIQRMATAPSQSTQFALPLGGDIDGDETTTALLGAVSLATTDYRYRYRLGRRQLLECVAPLWLIDWIRADMSRRAGVNYLDVTDEQITAWFSRRHLRPQFVYDWQDGYVDAGGSGFGGTAAPSQWPAKVDVLIYAPGTWVSGSKPIIDLSAVYDSTKLKDNEYIALFTEQATLLVKRCYASYKISVPLCPTGVTGSTVAFDCSAAA